MWVSANSTLLVVGLLWLLLQLTKDRMSSFDFRPLVLFLYSTLYPLFIQMRAYYTFQDSPAIQVPQHPDQPFVPNKRY